MSPRPICYSRKARHEPLTAAEQTRRSEYETQLAAGRKAFERYLGELEAAFARLDSEQRKDIERLNVAEAEALQGSLDELGHGAVLVHYVVLDDTLKIILTTPRLQRGYTVNVGRKPLNQAIEQLRKGIEGRRDVAQPARQLYDWLIAPLAADLQASGARTLMVALTDALRYLPFAALHDGQSWLAERYALALYTEAARQNIGKAPITQWQLQAFGLTRQVEGFPALPGVGAELAAIVGPSGLPGRIQLDGEFTAAAFQGAVDGRPPVLHVASHFVFRPGTEVDSFLLLGDGKRLSLADLKAYRFRQLDLLALSACETAMGGGQNENGREIEGFGALAQKRGAGAVLATLWPVADASTAQFMQQFYRSRQGQPGTTKAAALQQAQRALIEGQSGGGTVGGETERQAIRLSVAADQQKAPVDPARPYAHPYYWAPFVLMGNWL